MAVCGSGIGVDVGVAVGKDVGVFWAGWNGVRVGSTSNTDWFFGAQAATITIRQKDNNFFLYIDYQISERPGMGIITCQLISPHFLSGQGISFMVHEDIDHRTGWYSG